MHLYLSSYRLGDKTDYLKQWIEVSENNKIAFIPNAMDVYPESVRKNESIQGSIEQLEQFGFEVSILDLRKYFNKETELASEINKFNSVFARGGNSFALRLAMKLSGFDNVLKSKIKDESFLYGGFSAGICVLGPTMHGFELVDDANIEIYSNHKIEWSGIGLLDFVMVPHFDSNHPESEAIAKVVEYLREHGVTYKTLRDGDVAIGQYSSEHGFRLNI